MSFYIILASCFNDYNEEVCYNNHMLNENKKVLLGLSGGVDSAVAAFVLKEQGYDVTCAFMRNWDAYANNDILGNPTIQDSTCPQEEDYLDAKRVADKLGLELLRVDFIKEYWDNVFATFLKEYQKGRTPNPDILCNKYIKFDSFIEFARAKGFETIATGHYARIEHNVDGGKLLRGLDSNKDQTYFLAQINRDILNNVLFPIGTLDKAEVRRIANELNLAVANKKDSTGICFIGERNFRDFLKNYLPASDGQIVDIDTNEIVGVHGGVLYYTIGQRKGLGIGGEKGPWFVVGKDVIKNELYVVSGEDNPLLYSNRCLINDINLFNEIAIDTSIECGVKFRYRQKDNQVTLKRVSENIIELKYPQGVAAVTPGQEAVFYLGEECLGSGTIDQVFQDEIDLEALIRSKRDE